MLQSQSIAVVDDDLAMRAAFGDCLQVAGLSSEAYASAADFLHAYAPGSFCLIITDLNMPRVDGLELLRRLASLGEVPPVILVTSSAAASVHARAIRSGAVACFTKPVAHEVLLEAVRTALRAEEGEVYLDPSP